MVNYIVTNNSIVINYNAKTVTVTKEDGRYNDIILAIKDGRVDDIPELLDIKRKMLKSGFVEVEGAILRDGIELPKALSDRVINFLHEGLPFEPLLNLWDKLKKNQSYNSREMLYKFLEHNGHPITEDGCFIAYRGVTEDFKDPYSRTFDNSVGSVCEMPRDQVDDNPNNTCSRGLHVACFSYAHGFGNKTIEVKVDPEDVVCIPTDYNGTKMRVCKFEVMNVVDNENNEQLYKFEKTNNAEYLFDDVEDDFFDDNEWDF